MRSLIKLNILPHYRCNLNCKHCIYTIEQREDPKVLNVMELDALLNEVTKHFDIKYANIIGGETNLLSELYFDMLFHIIKLYTNTIRLKTNFLYLNKSIINDCSVIDVFHDFNQTKRIRDSIYQNIRAATASDKVIHIKTYDVCCKDKINQIIQDLNTLNVKSFEIMPHPFTKDFTGYEETILAYLNSPIKMNFAFQNKLQLEGILNFNNYEVKDVYITPNCKLALPDYETGQFSLQEFDNFDDFYKKFSKLEKKLEKFCEKCTSKKYCMANYPFDTGCCTNTCGGCKNLLSTIKH